MDDMDSLSSKFCVTLLRTKSHTYFHRDYEKHTNENFTEDRPLEGQFVMVRNKSVNRLLPTAAVTRHLHCAPRL